MRHSVAATGELTRSDYLTNSSTEEGHMPPIPLPLHASSRVYIADVYIMSLGPHVELPTRCGQYAYTDNREQLPSTSHHEQLTPRLLRRLDFDWTAVRPGYTTYRTTTYATTVGLSEYNLRVFWTPQKRRSGGLKSPWVQGRSPGRGPEDEPGRR